MELIEPYAHTRVLNPQFAQVCHVKKTHICRCIVADFPMLNIWFLFLFGNNLHIFAVLPFNFSYFPVRFGIRFGRNDVKLNLNCSEMDPCTNLKKVFFSLFLFWAICLQVRMKVWEAERRHSASIKCFIPWWPQTTDSSIHFIATTTTTTQRAFYFNLKTHCNWF